MANIFKRGDIWWCRFKVAGREYRRSLYTASRTEALKRAKIEREKIDHIRFHGEARVTWKQAVVEWAAASIDSIKPRTRERYLSSIRSVAGILDSLYLDEINRKTIAKIAGRPGVTNASRRRDLTAVSAVLRHAVAAGHIEQNIAREWDRSNIKERRDPITLPREADIDAVVAKAPGSLKSLIRFAQYTGMRQDEIVPLTRSQIDHRREAVQLVQTKRNRPRAVPLTPRALQVLEKTPPYVGSPLVFWHGKGKPYANVSSRFGEIRKRVVKEAEDKGFDFVPFRFHDLRHWYAVDYLRGGGSIYRLQQILGHESVKTTEIYLDYLTPEEAQRAKEAM